jgi:hypothetical protein
LLARITALIGLRLRRQTKIVGGSAETELIAVTVSARLPPGPSVVTTETPLYRQLMASTKVERSTSEVGAIVSTVFI